MVYNRIWCSCRYRSIIKSTTLDGAEVKFKNIVFLLLKGMVNKKVLSNLSEVDRVNLLRDIREFQMLVVFSGIALLLMGLKEDDDDNMYIRHYVSNRTEGVSDPGGKFLEALQKLVIDIDKNYQLFNTNACDEYRKLLQEEHFPGLGVAKKLSMQHHIEIIAKFLG